MEYMVIFVIIFAGILSSILYLLKYKPLNSWLIGCLIVPCFVLFAEFVLPYQGGGASMWPIALVVGGFFGTVSSGIGLLLGKYLK